MPDIRNAIQIDTPLANVYPLISAGSGFLKWWAEDVAVRPDGTVDLGFFNRATVYSLRLVKPPTPTEVEWLCLSGKEWKGTRLRFQMNETKGQTLLRFTHAGWEKETGYFISCSTTWGALMFRIKGVAEGRPRGPLFSRDGWSL